MSQSSSNATIGELKGSLENVVRLIEKLDLDQLSQQVEEKSNEAQYMGDLPHRVIHLKENPFNNSIKRWQQEFEELKIENQRLKIKLELIDTSDPGDISQRIDDVVNSAQKFEELNLKVTELKNREEKILASFRKTSRDFREACYLLTGYRIDALRGSVYRLSHMYAGQEQDKLSFKIEPHGDIKLIEDQYTKRLGDLIETYIRNCNSIPAFLASITLHLFKSQTQPVNMSITMSTTMHAADQRHHYAGLANNQPGNQSIRYPRTTPLVSSFKKPIEPIPANPLVELVGSARRSSENDNEILIRRIDDDLVSNPRGEPLSQRSITTEAGNLLNRKGEEKLIDISSPSRKASASTRTTATATTTTSDIIIKARQVEELTKKVAELKEREEKILESFKKTSREFKEVCYLLTGYRVEALKDGVFRLSSMYAEREDDKLFFKIEDGEIQLLENDHTERLSEFITTYLEEADSFPAFLASVTLDLFKSSTISVDMSMIMSTTILPNQDFHGRR